MRRLERLKVLAAAWWRPADYFRCEGCGSGPWHKTWWHPDDGDKDCPGPLGGCCSGAD
jgi:hypothetical protein